MKHQATRIIQYCVDKKKTIIKKKRQTIFRASRTVLPCGWINSKLNGTKMCDWKLRANIIRIRINFICCLRNGSIIHLMSVRLWYSIFINAQLPCAAYTSVIRGTYSLWMCDPTSPFCTDMLLNRRRCGPRQRTAAQRPCERTGKCQCSRRWCPAVSAERHRLF